MPYSIVRATQFYEFMDATMSWTSDEHTVRLPATRMQPIASADIARAVADVAVGAPLQGTRNVAGPEVFTLDELGRITLAARGDERPVVVDDTAGCSRPSRATPSFRAGTRSSRRPPTGSGSPARSEEQPCPHVAVVHDHDGGVRVPHSCARIAKTSWSAHSPLNL